MRIPSGTVCRPHRLTCPFCESGEPLSSGQGFVRCDSCGTLLIRSTLEVLHNVVGLPDALGSHPCERGNPEMRHLPYGVFHCPACRSEVLPFEVDRRRGHGLPRPLAGGADTPPNHRGAAGAYARRRTIRERRSEDAREHV
jgi:hypothetical protein